MSNKNIVGICRICGMYGKLTFEHILPKCALNDKKASVYTGDSFLKLVTEKIVKKIHIWFSKQ